MDIQILSSAAPATEALPCWVGCVAGCGVGCSGSDGIMTVFASVFFSQGANQY